MVSTENPIDQTLAATVGETLRIYVRCAKPYAKIVKRWLEEGNIFLKGEKIVADDNSELMRLPTTITSTNSADDPKQILASHCGGSLPDALKDCIDAILMPIQSESQHRPKGEVNVLAAHFNRFLQCTSTEKTIAFINRDKTENCQITISELQSLLPKRWILCPPLVLLASGSLSQSWLTLLERSEVSDAQLLWQRVLDTFSTASTSYTHIAVNSGIPLNSAEEDNTLRAPTELLRLHGDFGPDVAPYRFSLPDNHPRYISSNDFMEAFWVSCRQNQITQIWAPRWTMFSRGNVKEKARVLTFDPASRYSLPLAGPTLKDNPELLALRKVALLDDLKAKFSAFNPPNLYFHLILPYIAQRLQNKSPLEMERHRYTVALSEYHLLHLQRCLSAHSQVAFTPVASPPLQIQIAVDLYAGIGYFTLPYLKLGFDVIAYELNPFSVEGLRRGAEANSFGSTVLRGSYDQQAESVDMERLLHEQGKRRPHVFAYERNNDSAFINFRRLLALRKNKALQPYRIRHINLGFLPSSSESWGTAAQLICTNIDGGYIHVHENVAANDIEKKGTEVRDDFDHFINPFHGLSKRKVVVEHVELVKTFAPGVWHVVFDVFVGPSIVANPDLAEQLIQDAHYFPYKE